MPTIYDDMSREQLIEEVARWKNQAARNAQTAVRCQIALKLARQFGVSSKAFDGGVSVLIADWLDHSPHEGVPWPTSVFARKWLEAAGYAEVDGKIGMRATVTLTGPEPASAVTNIRSVLQDHH